MPYYPEPSQDQGIHYDMEYYWDHVVAEYLGCSVFEARSLNLVDYLIIRREAFIAEMSRTKEGRDYLNKAYMFEQTEADYDGLKSFFGKGGRV